LVAVAWLLGLAVTLTNHQYLLNHHWLMDESGLPWPIATLVFLGIWQVMMAAMMLPSSMPALYRLTYASRDQARHRTRPAWFLAGLSGGLDGIRSCRRRRGYRCAVSRGCLALARHPSLAHWSHYSCGCRYLPV